MAQAIETPTKLICVTVENDDSEQSEEQGPATNSQGQRLVPLKEHKWQKQNQRAVYITLKVLFMERAPDGNEEEILDWMREWSKHCGVEFEKTTYTNESSIRITFKKGDGDHSLLGTQAKKKPLESTMNLENVDRCTVLHETGHALGFGHEHQSPHVPIQWNTEALIKELTRPPYNWSEDMIKKNIIDHFSKDESSATNPADSKSIMAYTLKRSWVVNADKIPEDFFNESTELSEEDKRKAAEWYRKPQISELPDPPKPQPPTLMTGGGIPSNDVEKAAPTDDVDSETASQTSQLPDAKSSGSDKLTIKNLGAILKSTLGASSQWYNVGLCLGMSPDKLDTIEGASKGNKLEDCYRDTLREWLKDEPALSSLVEALESPLVSMGHLVKGLMSIKGLRVNKLTINDLGAIHNSTLGACPQWYNVGICLGISPDKLDIFERENKCAACYRAILREWLKEERARSSLVEALESPAVGMKHLAKGLEMGL